MTDGTRTIVVTGVTGFIGRHLCARLEADRAGRVVGLERTEASNGRGEDREPVDTCVHLAWYARHADYLESPANEASLDYARSVLETLCRRGLKHFVGIGTCLEKLPDDHPLRATPYVRAKEQFREIAEKTCAEARIAFTWARLFLPYGPGEPERKLASLVIRRMMQSEPLALNAPDNTMDFIYIDDVASALSTIVTRKIIGIVDIGSGVATSVRDVIAIVAATLGRATPEIAKETKTVANMPVADTKRLREAGWSASVDLADGIRKLINHITRLEHT